MTIERVTIEDTKELLEIYGPYVKNTAITFEYDVPSHEEFEERIRTISAKFPYIKAVENGEILGYAYATTFKGRAAYDHSVETTIYLRGDCKGKGLGKQLYMKLEESLKGMGIFNLNACIAYAKEEDEHLTNDSYHFHSKLGYELVGTFHNSGYKFNTWYDMIWMEKLVGDYESEVPPVKFGEWEI